MVEKELPAYRRLSVVGTAGLSGVFDMKSLRACQRPHVINEFEDDEAKRLLPEDQKIGVQGWIEMNTEFECVLLVVQTLRQIRGGGDQPSPGCDVLDGVNCSFRSSAFEHEDVFYVGFHDIPFDIGTVDSFLVFPNTSGRRFGADVSLVVMRLSRSSPMQAATRRNEMRIRG